MLIKSLFWRLCAVSLTLLAAGLPLPAARSAAAPLAPAAGWHGLTAMLPPSVTLYNWAISPDSQYAVFVADIDVDDRFELYSVPISGSVPVKLNGPLVAGGGQVNDFTFEISPDSSRVIYRTDQDVDNRKELYSVPIGGGTVVKLNGPMVTGGNVDSYLPDPDSERVVYIADQQSNDVFELYSVPIAGGAFVKLNPPLVASGDVHAFESDPEAGVVVYTADQDTNDRSELYSVPMIGGSSTKLNLPVAASIGDFRIATGQAIVFFVAEPMGGGGYQLYAVDTVGGTVLRRSRDLNAGENVISFQISPTGGQVVYDVAGNNQFTPGDLYATGLLMGTSHPLTAANVGFGVHSLDYAFTPDGSRIVCIYQHDASSPKKLESLNATGLPVISVDLFVPDASHSAGIFRISPDSQWVVFQNYDNNNFNNSTLSAIPTPGGSAVGFGLGTDPIITPDSQRVIYRVPSSSSSELFSSQIFGGGLRNLSRVGNRNYAIGAQLSPDGQWIVYETQFNSASGTLGYQLRASDGSEAPPVFNMYLPLALK